MKKTFIIIVIIFTIIGLISCGGTKEEVLKDENIKQFETMMAKNANGNYDYGEYKLITKGDSKTLKITFEFKTEDVFRVGTVTAIRNLVLEHLSGKYQENIIELRIASEKPTRLADYKYENGAWDKEVK